MRRPGESPALLLTGGASHGIEKLIRLPCETIPDLVLRGLARYAARSRVNSRSSCIMLALTNRRRGLHVEDLTAGIGIGVVALWSGLCTAADVAAGKAAAQAKCVECHEADDWEGESTASLEGMIRDIVAGKVKHKNKLELSAAEIANIAAYWGQGR